MNHIIWQNYIEGNESTYQTKLVSENESQKQTKLYNQNESR